MKFSFPVICGCGETFAVNISGMQFPKEAKCSKRESTGWLPDPLGNIVAMAIRSRAWAELKDEDWTLALVLSAMAVECELAYLFMNQEAGLILAACLLPMQRRAVFSRCCCKSRSESNRIRAAGKGWVDA